MYIKIYGKKSNIKCKKILQFFFQLYEMYSLLNLLIPKKSDMKSLKTAKTVLLDWLYFSDLSELFLKQTNKKIPKLHDLWCNMIGNAIIQFLACIFRSRTVFIILTWMFISIFLTMVIWAVTLVSYMMLHHYLLKFYLFQFLRLTFQNYRSNYYTDKNMAINIRVKQ